MTLRQRRPAHARRFLHDDLARVVEVLDKALGDDPRHEPVPVVLPLAAVKAQREREGFGAGGREAVGGVGHCARVADRVEHY